MIIPDLAKPIKVWYESLPGSGSIVKWPILKPIISYKTNILPQGVYSLIDSGADTSILHLDLAKALGIDLKNEKLFTSGKSVSGNYKFWIIKESLQLNIFGYAFDFKFTVVDNPRLIFGCILGENSIFEVARIDFHKFKNFYEIRFRQDIN